ncbi:MULTISPECIES: winged helix-turn-helix domain-containing protein [unclassified Rhodococcus (in: high G+C Gram-positive bacteria)]|uniref:winged helix-turn-helix domain-containing protein n=1 Tax=unclassified Rhodococcus (in: high G+C Gram-positive bacteria) TaxID=192944 RepID=UPI0029541084|nr:winged helix-turn-helix domain-containing protein [Rhodococcus sp. IEGM 1343]MDV8055867.1 winged helix-turn-helix domain-containing protein [Rhodococcus sp. IEGM 1343]
MSTEATVVVRISDSGTASLQGLTRPQLHALADALRSAAKSYAPHAKILTRFDVRVNELNAPLVIDIPARDVILGGRSVRLSHTEFEIFAYLAQRPRVVVGRSELSTSDGGRSVDVHLSRVRTKLGHFGRLITTVRGTGYRFDPEPGIRVVTAPTTLRSA